MSNSSRRLSRGDRRRNDRLAAPRAVITRHSAVLAFDLAADKQVCALTDQDSRVLARRTVKAKAWQLREAVEWGLAQTAAAGFSSVVVACEPTGHRWRVLDQIAAEAGARLVCVQPLLVHRARESEDFTHNKNDETDAMIIARLGACQVWCVNRQGGLWSSRGGTARCFAVGSVSSAWATMVVLRSSVSTSFVLGCAAQRLSPAGAPRGLLLIDAISWVLNPVIAERTRHLPGYVHAHKLLRRQLQ